MVALRAPAAALPIFRDAHDGAGPRRRDQSDCHTKHLSLTLDAALRPGECLLGGSAAAPLGGRARPVATASCRSACRARRGACRGRADLLPVVGCCSHTRLARDAGEHLQHRGAGGGPGARQARAPPLRNSDACLPRAGVSRCTGHGHAGQRPKRAVLSVAPCLADLLSSGTTPSCSQRVCLPCSTMPSETCAPAQRGGPGLRARQLLAPAGRAAASRPGAQAPGRAALAPPCSGHRLRARVLHTRAACAPELRLVRAGRRSSPWLLAAAPWALGRAITSRGHPAGPAARYAAACLVSSLSSRRVQEESAGDAARGRAPARSALSSSGCPKPQPDHRATQQLTQSGLPGQCRDADTPAAPGTAGWRAC